jgi:hypothetical protein
MLAPFDVAMFVWREPAFPWPPEDVTTQIVRDSDP